jgi:outer membrane protein assembly factor BamB
MKRFVGVWVVALAAVFGCAQPVPEELAAWTPARDLDKVGLQVFWQVSPGDLGISGGEFILSIHRLQENVYCLTSNNRLVALDAATGVFRWSQAVAPGREKVYRPIHVSGMSLIEKVPGIGEILDPKAAPLPPFDAVLVNSSSEVVVMDRRTGKVVRRVDLDYGASCVGTTDGSIYYAGAADGRYYGVSLQRGLKTWTAYAGDSIEAPMEFYGNALYVASVNGTIRTARTLSSAEELVKRPLGGPVTAGFYVDARGCFVPCEDNFLYAFTSDLATKLWDHPFACRGPLRRAVQVGEKTVFARAEQDKFYAINLVDGQERWSLPLGLQVLAADGKYVFVRDTAGRLLQVDEILGTTKATADLAGLDLFSGNVTDPVIYAAHRGGQVVCIKPVLAGRMTVEMLKKTQR